MNGYSIFDRDFYPTPEAVIYRMMMNSNVDGKVVLEPSAGSGNIVDWCKEHGAKDIIACERIPQLQKVLSGKCRIISDDFLKVTSEEVSHVDMIIMNPPFSSDETHILHAYDIAPEGCEIISLCNYSTISGLYENEKQKQLKELIALYGDTENFGDCFNADAERKTGVDIGCVHIFKPKSGDNEFDGYFSEEEEMDNGNGQSGIMTYNVIRDIVNRYVSAVRMFDGVMDVARKINEVAKPFSDYGIKFGAYNTSSSRNTNMNTSEITRDEYKKYLQKRAWNYVFEKMNMQKYVTKGVREDINKFVEKQENIPFTMKNISLMLDMIVGTQESRMKKVLCEAFDKICSFSAENSTAGEKWKTNSDYKIKKKFIVPYICSYDSRWDYDSVYVKISYSYNNDIDDIVKALCFMTGISYDNMTTLDSFCRNVKPKWGEWSEWAFFRIKGFKKGTMHFEFQDDKTYELFNLEVAKAKGWQLPKARKGA